MAGDTEQPGIHTVAISKTAATIAIGLVLASAAGFARSYWNLASSNAVLVEQVAQLRTFAAAGDRCTRETCQNTRETLERLRAEVRQHRDDAEEWKRRIVSCEIRVTDCEACKVRFGLKQNGGSN